MTFPMDLQAERYRTAPDWLVYCPDTLDQSTHKTSNEHFLVHRISPDVLVAVWTQSSYEGEPDQHIVFSKSHDNGKSWWPPRTIAGTDKDRGWGMASWAFPLFTRSGRIYVLFSRHLGINDFSTHTAGLLSGIYSDNGGETWSEPEFIPMPRSPYDHADPQVPPNLIIWQKPLRFTDDKYLVGATRWSTRSPSLNSVAEFLRFENIDDNPEVAEITITWLTSGKNALQYGKNLEEPSIVSLPDGRLFAVMRTSSGHPCFTVSADSGNTWSSPEPLRWRDNGPIMPHPLSPCPIYQFDQKTSLFFFHNHNGAFLQHAPDSDCARRPICLAKGEFRENAKQPIWFSEPWYFMDNGGVRLLRAGFSLYSSVTPTDTGITLWYPDRKFFLLGRDITRDMIAALKVPEA